MLFLDEQLFAVVQPHAHTSLVLGARVILVCVGVAYNDITWYHDNLPIVDRDTGSGGTELINEFITNGNQLIINELMESYYGNYRCEYSYKEATVSSAAYHLYTEALQAKGMIN